MARTKQAARKSTAPRKHVATKAARMQAATSPKAARLPGSLVNADDFHRFIEVQRSGAFNMVMDPGAAIMAQLSSEQMVEIFNDYAKFNEAYGKQ